MADVDLKILISIAQESKAALASLGVDLNTTLKGLQALATTRMDAISNQISGLQGHMVSASKSVENFGTTASKHFENTEEKAEDAAKGIGHVNETLSRLKEGLEFATGGFLALETVRTIREFVEVAARAQTFAVTLEVVGRNAGYTSEQLREADSVVQSFGATAEESRKSLTQLIQANLELGQATQLASKAQDLAALSGSSVGEALEKLSYAVTTLNVRSLRSVGLVIDQTRAENEYALSIHKTAQELTSREQSAAIAQAAITGLQQSSGAYEETLGTVTRESNQLTVATDALHEAIGNKLTPTYAAIIRQLGLFFSQSSTVVEGMDAQGQSAQNLADNVENVISSVRVVIGFFEEHYKASLLVAGAIGLIAFQAAKATFFETSFGEAVGETTDLFIFNTKAIFANIGAVFGDIGALLSLAGTEGVVAAATLGVTTAFNTLKVAMLANPITTIAVILAGVAAAFYEVEDAQNKMVTGATWTDNFNEHLQIAKENLQQIAHLIDAIHNYDAQGIANFQHITESPERLRAARDKRLAEEATKANEIKPIADAQKAYSDSLDDASVAATTLVRARNPAGGLTEEQISEAEKSYKEATQRVVAAKAGFERSVEGTGLSPSQRAEAERKAEEQRKKHEIALLGVDAQDALRLSLGNDTIDAKTGNVESGQVSSRLGAFQKELDEFIIKGKDSVSTVNSLRESLRNATTGAKLPQDLEAIRSQLDKVNAAIRVAGSPEQAAALRQVLQGANTDYATAALGVRRDQLARVDAPLAELRTQAKNRNDAVREAQEDQLNIIKEANAEKERQEKSSYQEGTTDLDKYYADRETRIVAASQAEAKVLETNLAGLQRQRALTSDFDPNGQKALDNQIKQAQAAIAANAQKQRDDIADNTLDKEQKLYDLTNRIKGIQNETLTYYAGLDGQLATIAEKFRLLRIQFAGLVTPGKPGYNAAFDDALTDAEGAEREKAAYTDRNRLLDQTKSLKDSISAIDKADIGELAARGEITDLEKQNALNSIAIQQQQAITDEIRAREEELAGLQAKREDYEARNNVVPEGIDTDIAAQQTKINELKASFADLGASIHTFGDDLRKNLTDGIGNALDEIIEHTKNAGEAVKDLVKSFTHEIVSTYTKDLAQRFVGSIVNNSSKKDANGNPIAGTSAFDSIGKAFGLDKGVKFGESASKPLFVTMTNHQDITAPIGAGIARAASGGGSTTFPSPTGDGTTISTPGARGASPFSSTLTGAGTGKAGFSIPNPFSMGAVGSAAAGEGLGGAIGDIVAHATTASSHHGPERALAMLKLGSRGSAIGGAAGAIGGLWSQFRTKTPKAPLGATSADELKLTPMKSLEDNQFLDGSTPGTDALGVSYYADGGYVQGYTDPSTGMTVDGEDKRVNPYVGHSFLGSLFRTLQPLGLDTSMWKTVTGHAGGGMIPGSGSGDTHPAMLTPGEFVVKKPVVQAGWLPLLQSLNDQGDKVQSIAVPGKIPHFASGGLVGGGAVGNVPIGGNPGVLQVQLHPDALNMSMQDFLQAEVARQYAERS